LNNTKLKHTILYNKANIAVADNDHPLAISLYRKVQESSDPLLSIASRINLSGLENEEQSLKLLETALKMTNNLAASNKQIEFYLSLAKNALEIDSQLTLNTLKALDQINLSNKPRYLSQKYGLKDFTLNITKIQRL